MDAGPVGEGRLASDAFCCVDDGWSAYGHSKRRARSVWTPGIRVSDWGEWYNRILSGYDTMAHGTLMIVTLVSERNRRYVCSPCSSLIFND